MSQLSDALAWLKRVKKLLNLSDLSSMEEELNQLRQRLLEFGKKSEGQELLAPEFILAMTQLADALSTELKPKTELSEDDQSLKQMVLDFRGELVELHRSLESVLTSVEQAQCTLALELADGHFSVGQFESAMRLLQQEWHRAKAIQKEKSESSSPSTVSSGESGKSDMTDESDESDESILDLQPEINVATQAVSDLLAKMNPLSTDEQIQCAVFANMFQQLMMADKLQTALSLLVSWKECFEELLKQHPEREELARKVEEERLRKEKEELERLAKEELQRKEKEERERQEKEERERKEREERERLEKEARELKEKEERERREREEQEKLRIEAEQKESKSKASSTLEEIKQRVQTADSSLTETFKLLTIYLSSEEYRKAKENWGKLVQAVETHYGSFSGSEYDEMSPSVFVVKQDEAFQALKKLEELVKNAQTALSKRQATFNKKLEEANKTRQTILDENVKAIAELDIANKQLELAEYKKTQEELKLRDPASDKVVSPLFGGNARVFFQGKLDAPKADKSSKDYKFAQKIIGILDHYDELTETIKKLEAKKIELQKQCDEAVKKEDSHIESLKIAQTIQWSDPSAIVYGTPLSELQLNATLSANDGTIQYFYNGKPIEIGKTILPAGDALVLTAKAIGTNSAIFQKTPDKEVKIQVKPAEVVIGCETAIEITYGTELNETLLKATVTTTPLVETDHPQIVKNLTFWIDGKAIAKNSLLDVGEYTVIIKTADNKNYNAAQEKTAQIKVKPAELEIVWDKPTPTTFTYGQWLTSQQLNATIVVTTSPPLTSMLPELNKLLGYFDESDKQVTTSSVLSAGEERTITVKASPHKNFVTPKAKVTKFKVEKALREIGSSKLDPIGECVMASDMQQIQKKFKFIKGTGQLEFSIDKVKLAVGVKLKPGDNQTLTAVAVESSDYQLTLPKEEAVDVVTLEQAYQTNKGKYDELLLKNLHSTQKSALDELHKAIDLVKKDDTAKNFENLNKLIEEMQEIATNLVSWTELVVSPVSPNGEIEFPDVEVSEDEDILESVRIQNAKNEARDEYVKMILKLIKHGGITRRNIAKLVPKGETNHFSSSLKYPSGFKYTWSTPGPHSMEIEVYGHGPTIDNYVADDSDSKKGNLVRIMIDGRYVKPNGTLTSSSTDATSHMALY